MGKIFQNFRGPDGEGCPETNLIEDQEIYLMAHQRYILDMYYDMSQVAYDYVS
jgi:hypothetical protein